MTSRIRAQRGRWLNESQQLDHCCIGAHKPDAIKISSGRSSRGAPPTPGPGASLACLPPATSTSPRDLAREAGDFLSDTNWSNLNDGMGFSSLNWFLVFRMGGERQSVWAQGGNRGVRRRVVEDAGPKLLLGNVLLSPRPLGAFCPVNCRGGGGSSSGRHAGALQGEDRVPGPEAWWGELRRGGCGVPEPHWLSGPRPSAP